MHITLSPIRLDGSLNASCTGDVIILNGTPFDFGPLADGATLPAEAIDSDWIVGPVSRVNGTLFLTLRLPHGPNPPQAVAFPEPIVVSTDGPIILPTDEVNDD